MKQAAVDQSAEKEAKAIMKERERLQKEALKVGVLCPLHPPLLQPQLWVAG